jgi:hypothetical protein
VVRLPDERLQPPRHDERDEEEDGQLDEQPSPGRLLRQGVRFSLIFAAFPTRSRR